MAKYLTSVYVSGWQCSSTASTSNEPGPDVADYPYDTVPNKVWDLKEFLEENDGKDGKDGNSKSGGSCDPSGFGEISHLEVSEKPWWKSVQKSQF